MRCSIKKGVLENFAKVTETQPCQGLFLNKNTGPSPEKKSLAWVFYCEYCEIFKNNYFEEHLRKAASDANQFLAARQLVIKKLQNEGKNSLPETRKHKFERPTAPC